MHPHLAKHLVLAAVALALLGGVIWYIATHPAPASPLPDDVTSTPLGGASEPSVIREDAPYYEIEASYPSAVSLPLSSRAGAGASAQASMKQWVVQSIAEFKANGDFSNLTQADIEILRLGERKYALDIRYTAYAGKRTVSYVYSLTQDTGGAHPNTTYRTFTFDATTGAELSLGSLFVPGADYATRLSAIAQADLPAVIGEFADTAFIAAGTAPVPTNFGNFYINGSMLVIIFPPYQVGPYALGTVKLPIELSRLASILKTEFK